jgi:Domain of unknown function (DU1801)
MTHIGNSAVAEVFRSYPPEIRRKVLALRKIIFEVANNTPGVGELEETLKWGEPAYMTAKSKSGSTIRLGWKKSDPAQYAIYFNCQTNLVESFRALFRSEFSFAGNRAIVFDVGDLIPKDALCVCIAAALTYHRDRISGKKIFSA